MRIWRLPKDPPQEQVRAALDVLHPAPRYRAVAREEIEKICTQILVLQAWRHPFEEPIKPLRKATLQLQIALRRAAAAAQMAARIDDNWVFHPIKLDADIEYCEKYLAHLRTIQDKRGPPRRRASKQYFAVKYAYDLIFKFGDRNELRLTRDKTWHQLSAILYGDPKIDLFNHMRRISRVEDLD